MSIKIYRISSIFVMVAIFGMLFGIFLIYNASKKSSQPGTFQLTETEASVIGATTDAGKKKEALSASAQKDAAIANSIEKRRPGAEILAGYKIVYDVQQDYPREKIPAYLVIMSDGNLSMAYGSKIFDLTWSTVNDEQKRVLCMDDVPMFGFFFMNMTESEDTIEQSGPYGTFTWTRDWSIGQSKDIWIRE